MLHIAALIVRDCSRLHHQFNRRCQVI